MGSFKDWVVGQIKGLRPSFMSHKPHFNFITAHYFYILGLTFIGSILLFAGGRGNISYTDALFFGACASTQAGLNVVDINKLNTFQQIVIYIIPMLANPITINSFVVFLRLYWFEKRFQHIVQESRLRRGTISRAKSKAKSLPGDLEKGVNGRKITVMLNGHRSRMTPDGTLLEDDPVPSEKSKLERRASDPLSRTSSSWKIESDAHRHPDIKFSRTVTKSDGMSDDVLKLPPLRSEQEHIAILERQRKDDDEVLRIPNPRDAERGVLPKRVVAGEDDEPDPLSPARGEFSHDVCDEPQHLTFDGRQQAITIEEPDRRKLEQSGSDDSLIDARAAVRALSWFRIPLPRFWKRGKARLHDNKHPAGLASAALKGRRRSLQTLRTVLSRDKVEGTPYLSWEPTIGRNSAFPDLTEEQREELGGIEYRSLKTLAVILVCYFWVFSILGVIGLLPWILHVQKYGQVVTAAGVSKVWWAFFTANSAFMDLGFTLTPDSMNSFNTATWPLLFMSFLIIIGNTGFPIMLRFIIWSLSLVTSVGTGLYEELRFLLDHPRRCFTLLFPSAATWWLFGVLIVLNVVDVILFIVLDLGAEPVIALSPGLKVLNGLFEAVSTRTAGFSSVNLGLLHPAVQSSYMIMMYISVFPIAISVRRTNVYEEQSLGVYTPYDLDDQGNQSDMSYVGTHLRRQLSFDLWYIFVGFFILNITEGSKLMANRFSGFAILFEVVSAYGTVGMSLGYSGGNESLSSQFSVIGKLVIIAMMIRGRHRGLPYGLDRAILLPSESLSATEASAPAPISVEPEIPRISRLYSRTSAVTGGPDIGSSARHKSFTSADPRNLLASILHPGPPLPSMGPAETIRRAESIRRMSIDPSLVSGLERLERQKSATTTFSQLPQDPAGASGAGASAAGDATAEVTSTAATSGTDYLHVDQQPWVTRITSRRTEPGASTSRRDRGRGESISSLSAIQRPKTSGPVH